jgi:hypothetical protein
MKLGDRDNTTRYASAQIDNLLSRGEHTSALLLAFIYVDIRLTSLLTDRLSPSEEKWEELADLIGNLNFRRKVELCTKKGLFDRLPMEPSQLGTKFKKLGEKRNDAAHETRLWKTIGQHDAIAIRERCQFAKEFLAITTKRHHHPTVSRDSRRPRT